MRIVKLKEQNQFAITGMSFTELKTIKDACKFYGDQGSNVGKQLAQKLEHQMNEVTL